MFSVIRVTSNDDPSDSYLVVVKTGESAEQPYTTRTVVAFGLSWAEANKRRNE